MVEEVEYSETIRRIINDVSENFPYIVRAFGGIDRKIHSNSIVAEGISVDRWRDTSYKTLALARCRWGFMNNGVKTPGGAVNLLVKYYSRMPHVSQEAPWRREAQNYLFLKETGYVPKAYLMEDIIRGNNGLTEEQLKKYLEESPALSRSVLIEFLGDTTFEDTLPAGKEERLARIRKRLESLVDFQAKATSLIVGRSLDSVTKTGEKDIYEKVIDAARACLGLDSAEQMNQTLIKRLTDAYKVIVNLQRNCRNPVICHGDYTPPNIILTSEGDRYIDVDPTLTDGIDDVIRFISWAGMRLTPREWKNVVTDFRQMQLERSGAYGIEVYLGRVRLAIPGGRLFKVNVDEKTQKDSFAYFLGGAVGFPFTVIGKVSDMKRLLPFAYAERKKKRPILKEEEAEFAGTMRQAMDTLKHSAADFGIPPQDVDRLYALEEIFGEIGVFRRNRNFYDDPERTASTYSTAPQQNLNTVAS